MSDQTTANTENEDSFESILRLIDIYGEVNRPPTLSQLLKERLGYPDGVTQEIIDIVAEWLPKEDSKGGFDVLQWNKCVRRMRENLK
jgi:hypothetical protein